MIMLSGKKPHGPHRSDQRSFRRVQGQRPAGADPHAQPGPPRAQAAYPDGRKATGAEAYAAYGRESGPVFERLGGRIVWQGRFELMLIGPAEERWDHCFIAEYPSVGAFAEMIRDPVYREAVKHRQAAVEDSRLVRHAVLPVGKTFGEIPK